MQAIIIKVIAGALIGSISKIICDVIEKWLLSRRDLEYNHSKVEDIILFILMAAMGAVTMWRVPISAKVIYSFLILIICELVAVIDLHHRIIPNGLILAMMIISLGFGIPGLFGIKGFLEFDIVSSLIGLVVGFVIFALPAVLSRSVGAGDIKFAAAIGFGLGVMNLLYIVVVMGICVILYTITQMNIGIKLTMHRMIPMGPFLAVATMVVVLITKCSEYDWLSIIT